MDRELLAERIRLARLSLGLSPAEFADHIGVSRRTVEYWESGKRVPLMPTLRKIAAASGYPPGWFFGIENAPAAPVAI